MIKEILILLWILIIPLMISFSKMIRLIQASSLVEKKKLISLSHHKKYELSQTLIKVSALMFVVSVEAGAQFGLLKGILAGEVIVCDLMTLAFYFDWEKSVSKRIFTFLFVFINFWISALWAIQGQLSQTVLWVSVLSYPIFGLSYILPYFLKEETK